MRRLVQDRSSQQNTLWGSENFYFLRDQALAWLAAGAKQTNEDSRVVVSNPAGAMAIEIILGLEILSMAGTSATLPIRSITLLGGTIEVVLDAAETPPDD